MNNCRFSISKEEYNELKDKPRGEISAWLQSQLSIDIICGYGYYGCGYPQEENGKYFIEYSIGSSCD